MEKDAMDYISVIILWFILLKYRNTTIASTDALVAGIGKVVAGRVEGYN